MNEAPTPASFHDDGSAHAKASLAFLSGGGELGSLVRAHDWANTPLGPPQQWPQSLRQAVSTCLNCSFAIVIWWGRDLTLIYNDPYTSILANKHPRALGRPGEECWREVWPLVGPMLHRVLDEAKPFTADDLELMVWRHDYFEECYFCFSYSPIYEENGNVSGVFCPVIETSEKIIEARRLETLRQLAALRRAETIKGACEQAIAVLAKNGRDVPFAFLYLLSEDGGAATLMAATDGTPQGAELGLADLVEWPLADALAQPCLLENLTGMQLPTGAWPEPPQQAYLAPVVLPGSRTARAVLVTGLSPHKRLDKSYRSFLELLVAQVGATIADTLAYEAERQRAVALAEIDRAKTVFFSNVSHEFRTPLTLMLGPLEDLLARPSIAGEEQQQLSIVHRNGLRLLRLVNSLLDFSRVEAGRVQASYEPTDLATLTADLASSFRSACENGGLRLEVNCPALPELVYVDREMWEKIVLNLVSNAFKFTFEGTITVTVRGRSGHAVLTVQDTGTGIPQNELPRIFERFHRVENARGRTHEGSGIGLALVQELVRLHGGTISAESTEGRGSTFTVQIPFGTSRLPDDRIGGARTLASTSTRADAFVAEALRWLPATAISAESPSAVTASEPRSPLNGGLRARLLLADDNADMRDYVRRLLEPHYEVETAPDGQAALEKAVARLPDILLTDVMMPRLDGFGLLRAIRSRPESRRLPVVLLSARAGEEAKIEGLTAGADDYLTKPFSAQELLVRVAANLKMARIRHNEAEALRESATSSPVFVIGSRDVVYRMSSDWSEMQQLKGHPFLADTDKPSKLWMERYIEPEDRPMVRAAIDRAIFTKGTFELEHRVRRADGSIGWTLSRAVPMLDEHGGITEWRGAATDITPLKQAEAALRKSREREILIYELQHRTRNLLTVVSALADQTLAASRSLEDFAPRFEERLAALGRVQGLLSRDVQPNVTVEELIRLELTALGLDQSGKVVLLEGPNQRLPPAAIQLLALSVHELLTNAMKHGALRRPEGRLEITWSRITDVARDRLRLGWRESGAALTANRGPSTRGFGLELLESLLPFELDATTTIDFARDGIHVSVDLPL